MTANPRASSFCGSRSATAVPSSAPTTVEPASAAVTAKCGRAPVRRWVVRATMPVSVMITSEVATARRKARPRPSASTGTIMKPPPTPKKPVSMPTPSPAPTTTSERAAGHSASTSLRPAPERCQVAPAATSMIGTNERISTRSLTARLSSAPANDPAAAGAAKSSASRQHTWPSRARAPAPTAAASAITISDAVEAGPTPSPSTETSTGSARIAPPPPTAPTISPMARPNGIASSSIRRASWRGSGRAERAGGRHRPQSQQRRSDQEAGVESAGRRGGGQQREHERAAEVVRGLEEAGREPALTVAHTGHPLRRERDVGAREREAAEQERREHHRQVAVVGWEPGQEQERDRRDREAHRGGEARAEARADPRRGEAAGHRRDCEGEEGEAGLERREAERLLHVERAQEHHAAEPARVRGGREVRAGQRPVPEDLEPQHRGRGPPLPGQEGADQGEAGERRCQTGDSGALDPHEAEHEQATAGRGEHGAGNVKPGRLVVAALLERERRERGGGEPERHDDEEAPGPAERGGQRTADDEPGDHADVERRR